MDEKKIIERENQTPSDVEEDVSEKSFLKKMLENNQKRTEARNELKKLSFIKTFSRCLALIVVAICVASSIHIVVPMVQNIMNKGEQIYDNATGKINIPYPASYFKMRSSDDVFNQLRDMGFKNIAVEEIETNICILFKPGTIQSVRIKGDQNFNANKKFDDNDTVVIKKYVNSSNYKEKYVVFFISLVLIAVFVSLCIIKKKTVIYIVSVIAIVTIICTSYFIINDLNNANSKFSFLTESCEIEFNINSDKNFIINDYSIAVKIDGKKLDSIIDNGAVKKIGPMKLKKGKHTVLIYDTEDNSISAEQKLNIAEDMIYDFIVKKKKDSIEIKLKTRALDSVE